jgi:hypothetical protein
MKTSELTVSANFLSVTESAVKKTGISLSLLAALLMIFLVPFNALASRERFVLDFNDSHISGHRGEPATLYLKRSLKQQYPRAEISKMDLRKVVLVAKSKKGRGGAQLRVGKRATSMQEVNGHPGSFQNNRRHSFDRVNFQNPSNNSRGPWQVDLKGNFIVRKVVLEVEDHSRPRHNGRWSHHNRLTIQ